MIALSKNEKKEKIVGILKFSRTVRLKPRLHQIHVAGYKWIQLVSGLRVSGVNAAL